MPDLDHLIDNLSQGLKPVRPVSSAAGLTLFAAVALATLLGAMWLWGLSAAVGDLRPSPMTLMSGGLFFLLGLAGGWTLTRMAQPTIGAQNNGWRWAAGAVAVLPVAALILMFASSAAQTGVSLDAGIGCLIRGLVASLAVAAALTWYLRRGAPLRVHTASLLVGLTAGAVGAVAVALNCPDDGLAHIGLWHAAIVAVAGALGRLSLPPLLRW